MWMFGPVFRLELTRERHGRRTWRLLPWAYAGLLGFQMLIAWHAAFTADRFLEPFAPPAQVFPEKMLQFVAWHFFLLFLLTPALTATALGEEKARGTLADLFTTHLTPTEIVGGKLAARSLRVAEMFLPPLPILFVLGGYAGLPLLFFVALVVVSLFVILGVGAVGLLCAVESKHTSGALLATYALVGAGVLAVRIIPLPALDPLGTLAPAWGRADPRATAWALGAAALAWLTVAGVGFALAAWRLRPDGLRQMQGGGSGRSAVATNRPPVDDDPIRWRGYYVEGLALLPLFRRVTRPWGVLAAGMAFTGVSAYSAFQSLKFWPPKHPDPWYLIVQGVLFLFAATLIVTVRAAGAVTGERERDTWDSLRLTPLDGRTFLNGKLRGIFDSVGPYFIAYTIPATTLSIAGGPTGLYVTIASLLIVWPLMYFAAACGLRTSVQARSTWRSLLAALSAVFGTGIFICFPITLAVGAFLMGLGLAIASVAEFQGTWVVALALSAWMLAPIITVLTLAAFGRSQLRQAEEYALAPPWEPAPSAFKALSDREEEGPRG
jgi:ABC-type transport system involved in multi-copper enzyme maturation permease subunit